MDFHIGEKNIRKATYINTIYNQYSLQHNTLQQIFSQFM